MGAHLRIWPSRVLAWLAAVYALPYARIQQPRTEHCACRPGHRHRPSPPSCGAAGHARVSAKFRLRTSHPAPSHLLAPACIISIAQHAKPNVMGQMLPDLAQLMACTVGGRVCVRACAHACVCALACARVCAHSRTPSHPHSMDRAQAWACQASVRQRMRAMPCGRSCTHALSPCPACSRQTPRCSP